MKTSNIDLSKLKIGTSGYYFPDWVGSFYPPRLAKRDYLTFYANEFDVVEVNASYYRIPSPKMMERMAAVTPSHFRFVVKAHQSFTHQMSKNPKNVQDFFAGIDPLKQAGKLDGLLFQFPFSVKNTKPNRDHLRFIRDQFPNHNLWFEFRHNSWNQPAVFELLRSLGVGYCAVDEPALPGLMPPVVHQTSNQGYVRFHGRNKETWWDGDAHTRYNWEYSSSELETWMESLRELIQGTQSTHLFFNNCYMGRAVKGARLLKKLLGLQTTLELGF